MNLIVIFGPQAVGKMTVGHELEKITGLKLFHNHMTIELVRKVFDFGTPQFRVLVDEFRRRVFEEAAKSKIKGIIFTYVWAFNLESEHEYIEKISQIFSSQGGNVYFVELEADMEIRLQRNTHEFRLSQKESKRDIGFSEKNLREDMKKHRLNSLPGEIKHPNYIKINNSNIPAKQVAKMIQEEFNL